ncbi:MAG TPA: phosphate ABC transporter substrate-binding protein PstS [Bryobacteraceae bacterium]|nr:phosphate ABC transporter substrate-binding protein PstS [Bryobacteraceae bacterium]
MSKLAFTGLAAVLAVVAGPASAQHLTGAGATFPAPIYTKWFSEYKTAHPDVQINYQPNGSAGGIKALTDGTVDFGASDMPMTDAQIKDVKVKPLHFPTVLGGVVLTYNLAGVSAPLKFSGDVIAGMYLGEIKKWNDPKIAADNPGVKLPGDEIVIVHRSDGSGTTFVFADYLSKVSPTWKSKVGANTSISWPTGVGQPKNDGVAGFVKQTPGAIGYVELIYAVENKMSFAQVKNAAGKYVTASFDSVTQAAANSKDLAPDFRGSITNAAGAGSYPISTYTWLLIPSHFDDAAKKKAITDFLSWMIGPGQKDAQSLSYATLPKKITDLEKKQIAEIK